MVAMDGCRVKTPFRGPKPVDPIGTDPEIAVPPAPLGAAAGPSRQVFKINSASCLVKDVGFVVPAGLSG